MTDHLKQTPVGSGSVLVTDDATAPRPTFEYPELQGKWLDIDETTRGPVIEKLLTDLRAYFDEGFEGDGDGWAPRTWEEAHRFAAIMYAIRDLRWKRDADGQGGLQIEACPHAEGRLVTTFVPHSPDRKGDIGAFEAPEITEEARLEWISVCMSKGAALIEQGCSITRMAQSELDNILRTREARKKAEETFQRLLTTIAETETPLDAQRAYLDIYGSRGPENDRYRIIHDTIVSKFAELSIVIESLNSQIEQYRIAAESGDVRLAAQIETRLLEAQTKLGFIPFTAQRILFDKIGRTARNKACEAEGITRGNWWRTKYPTVGPRDVLIDGGRGMLGEKDTD